MKAKRDMPERLVALAVLGLRTAGGHPSAKQIKTDCENRIAGYKGEKKADFFLFEAKVQDRPIILKDVDIPGVGRSVQADTVILHPAFVLILEVKNVTGELYFDDQTGQFYRIKAGKREGMRNPEDQLNRAVASLETHLASIGLPLPVEGAIVLASYNGLLQQAPLRRPALTVDRLPGHLEDLARANRFSFDWNVLSRIKDSLTGNQQKRRDDFLRWYNLGRGDILPGVRCPDCHRLGMDRGHGRWICTRCGAISKDAHLAALQEYRILFGERITSREAMWFLGLTDLSLSIRILNGYGIYEGTDKRNRKFILPQENYRLSAFVNHLVYKNY
ncbi:nuclease-related domain-containing protein [Bhargavaea cecembensis]|uniref:nuclease-related domain-containing protein n=1 Tax=Bhargavaea cecembensis TaxID=394098 RepID=UPI000694DBE6|nr:nuclease-related domain-containing protein [Bhargavaea cecembensis]